MLNFEIITISMIFGILEDTSPSIDVINILYFSDTDGSWDNRYKRFDKINSKINQKLNI